MEAFDAGGRQAGKALQADPIYRQCLRDEGKR